MNSVEPRDIDAHPIAWRETGPVDGEVVLFLHGLGGSRTAWGPQLFALGAKGFRCAAWDMPGYGASAKPSAPLTFELLTDAVAVWINALGIDEAHVVGLSFGGMVAQHVALRHPPVVRSLALVGTSSAFGFDGVTTADAWVEQRLRPLREGATPATIAEGVLRSVMGPDVDNSVVADAVSAMARITPEGLAGAVRCLVTHDARDELHRISAPTLVMVGEHDLETPPSYAAHLAAAIPGARFEVIPGVGHIANLEAPDAVNEMLIEFFAA